MTDYSDLMWIFSRPRPSGSAAERQTAAAIRAWLDARGLAHGTHHFRLYPYFNEALGAWIAGSRTLLALAVARRWGWATLPIAAVGMLGGTVDGLLGVPLVTWPGARRGESILVQLGPPGADREIILATHYDSKTELLDHRGQSLLFRLLPHGIGLTIALGLFGPLDRLLAGRRPSLGRLSAVVGGLLSLPMLALAWALGLNLALGRAVRPSQGAVDNGAACAILLGLARHLAENPDDLQRTRVTIAFFGGEEVGMQGSQAYLRDRAEGKRKKEKGRRKKGEARSREPGEKETGRQGDRRQETGGHGDRSADPRSPISNFDSPLSTPHSSLPNLRSTIAVNLEMMGQDGDYGLFGYDGTVLKGILTSAEVNAAVRAAVAEVTGSEPRQLGGIISDGASFLQAGVPTAVLASLDRRDGMAGMHRPTDRLERVDLRRLPESVEILARLVRRYDRQGL